MSAFRHAICTSCYTSRYTTAPRPVDKPRLEECCYCRAETSDGLYDRRLPVEAPCQGRRGSAHEEEAERGGGQRALKNLGSEGSQVGSF